MSRLPPAQQDELFRRAREQAFVHLICVMIGWSQNPSVVASLPNDDQKRDMVNANRRMAESNDIVEAASRPDPGYTLSWWWMSPRDERSRLELCDTIKYSRRSILRKS